MKHLILASLIAVPLLCAAQVARTQDSLTYPYKDNRGVIYGKPMPHQFAVDLLEWWDEWKDSCRMDTLRVKPYEGEFLVPRKGYTEMMSERALNRLGYRYGFRWITNTTRPFEWEYVFVKDPNDLQGFMEFIKRRTR